MRFESKRYRDWVKTLPCCLCGAPADDAHHVIGLRWSLSGMGMTAPDSFVMPLCRPHHNAVHQRPELQRLQPDWLRWTIARGIRSFEDGEIREALAEAWHFIDDKEAA